MLGDFEAARRLLRRGLLEVRGDWSMAWLRAAENLEVFGKLPWYWEIVDGMKFPPLQMDNPYFALEQAMRYGRGTVGAPASSTDTNEPPRTLAVLPFVNLGADKADEYLSDGMTEELLNVLAQVPGLRVPGRSSSFAFKGRNEDNIFRKVGEQLHVATVLEGSVRKAGDKVRITAQLINVTDGYHLWSQTYDRDMKDILAVQTEVAQQVVQSLQVKLGIEAARALAKTPTENPEAHRLYLLGRYHFGRNSEAGFTNAMQYFNQALQQDPNYALAYCGLADCYGWMGGHQLSGKEAWAKEKELAQKALALDPKLADAHLSLGIALADAFDWSGGEQEIRRALELNPTLALAYDQLAWVQSMFGRSEDGIRNIQKAIELDPLSLMFNYGLGLRLTSARRYDDAMAQFRKALELDPNVAIAHSGLGWCFVYKGDGARAIAEFQKAKALDPQPRFDADLAYAYAHAGDRTKAELLLRDWDERAKQRYVSPALRMLFHLGLGEKDEALDRLENCYEEQDWYCWSLKVYPLFDPLRAEPRFQALLKKVGFDP
jgi:serine/threonine-protein kinase